MNFIDFLIGFTLMNAMPHFTAAIFEIRFLAAYGFSEKANLAYSITNLLGSLGLFHFQYGIETILDHGIYVGVIAMLVIYYAVGKYCYNLFHKRFHAQKEMETTS